MSTELPALGPTPGHAHVARNDAAQPRRVPATGLRMRLVGLVFLAVLPAFGLILLSLYEERQGRMKEASALAEHVANRAAIEFGQTVDLTRDLMKHLVVEPEIRDTTNPQACGRALADVRARHPAFGLLGVIDRSGRTVCSDTARAVGVDLGDRDYFREVLRTRDFAVSRFVVGRVVGLSVVVLAAPVFDQSGGVQSVLFASLDLSWIQRQLEQILVPPGSMLWVVDGAGTVMATWPDNPSLVGRMAPEHEDLQRHGAEGHPIRGAVVGLDGVPRIVVDVPLPRTPRGSAFVRASIPTSRILAEANRALLRDLAGFAAVALAVFVAAWWFANVLVVRPTRRLIRAAEAIGRGELDARAGATDRRDELGALARHFDLMAGRVQRTTRALRALSASNRNLLRAADERTLLQDMAGIAVREGNYRIVWIGLLRGADSGGAAFETAAIAGGGADGQLWVEEHAGRDAEGPAVRAVRTGRPVVVHAVPYGAPSTVAPEGSTSLAACALPLKVHAETIGVLKLYAADVAAFDDAELDLLQEMAADLAFGIQTLRDRERQALAEEKLRVMAFVDALTGLPNRSSFETLATHALHAATVGEGRMAVLALRLDQFARVQNAIGFAQGDRLILDVATRLKAAVEPAWTLARLGGDRFAVLLPSATPEAAIFAARRLRTGFEDTFAIAGIDVELRAHVGVALYPQHGEDASLLLRRADVACVHAQAAEAPIETYREGSEQDSPAQLQLMVDLRRAIESDALSVHFQGKVDARTGQPTGAEALVRWAHPERGNLPPGQFIGAAEQTGLIRPLTDWVIDAVLRQLRDWSDRGIALPVAVNLSGRNFREPLLVERLQQALDRWGIDPKLLQVELTETVVMHDAEAAQKALTRLRAMGLKIFIDDFGTGYSSLRYLASLPVDVIKIDRSFIIEMVHRPAMRSLVAAIIDMGHKLGMCLVAEGVDDPQQAELLRELGCDEIQGYLYARPVAAAEFEAWLADRR